MVYELLSTGRENAKTGKDLAKILNCDIRSLTAQIERERRGGQPICANMTGINAGYFLAADETELQTYCNALYRRAGELHKTRRALLEILNNIAAQKDTAK